MTTPDVAVHQRLAELHPEAAADLARMQELAYETFDPGVLALCRDYLGALLESRPWDRPPGLSAREQAFLDLTEQFVTAVSAVTDEQVERLLQHASAEEVYAFFNALYVVEMSHRLQRVVSEVLP